MHVMLTPYCPQELHYSVFLSFKQLSLNTSIYENQWNVFEQNLSKCTMGLVSNNKQIFLNSKTLRLYDDLKQKDCIMSFRQSDCIMYKTANFIFVADNCNLTTELHNSPFYLSYMCMDLTEPHNVVSITN